ncbi:hypothetical protein [Leptobacterium sp. I13]|uniref:hypothetical protein n=1 Tax=Leptobacterium meishanense TaxID=3128904 RepID=UPI0030ED759F
MIDKEALKKTMVVIHQKHIDELENIRDSYKHGADLDEEDTRDPEDFSHQDEWTTASINLQLRIERAHEEMRLIEKFPVTPLNEVTFGAVVCTENLNFVIGTVMPVFDFDNKKFVGISENAPIYKSLKGKHIGDVFKFGDYSYTIKTIL